MLQDEMLLDEMLLDEMLLECKMSLVIAWNVIWESTDGWIITVNEILLPEIKKYNGAELNNNLVIYIKDTSI